MPLRGVSSVEEVSPARSLLLVACTGFVHLERSQRAEEISSVYGKHHQVQSQLWHLHHDEPGLRRSNGTTGQPEGAPQPPHCVVHGMQPLGRK